jgi:hypothetical protein
MGDKTSSRGAMIKISIIMGISMFESLALFIIRFDFLYKDTFPNFQEMFRIIVLSILSIYINLLQFIGVLLLYIYQSKS